MKVFVHVIIALYGIPFVSGSCDSIMYDILNCYGMYGVDAIVSPPSIVALCDHYHPMCNHQQIFLECYQNAMKECPDDFRAYNPMLFDTLSAKAVLLGCCAHIPVNNKGIECLGDSYSDVHKIISYYCFNFDDMVEHGFSAVASGNWTVFCSMIKENIKCLHSVLHPMNCSNEYIQYTEHLIYATLPTFCRDNSQGFDWLQRFGMSTSPDRHSSIFTIGFIFLIYIYLFL